MNVSLVLPLAGDDGEDFEITRVDASVANACHDATTPPDTDSPGPDDFEKVDHVRRYHGRVTYATACRIFVAMATPTQHTPHILSDLDVSPSVARARIRDALLTHSASVPRAAAALGCSAVTLRKILREHPEWLDGITLRARGWTKGRSRREVPAK